MLACNGRELKRSKRSTGNKGKTITATERDNKQSKRMNANEMGTNGNGRIYMSYMWYMDGSKSVDKF